MVENGALLRRDSNRHLIASTAKEEDMSKFCHACGNEIDSRAELCPGCGVRQPVDRHRGRKSRNVAAVLALFLGGIGAHKFYLGHMVWGLLYLVFAWTFIPAFLGFLEFFVYVSTSEETFAARHG